MTPSQGFIHKIVRKMRYNDAIETAYWWGILHGVLVTNIMIWMIYAWLT